MSDNDKMNMVSTSKSDTTALVNPYETDPLVNMYCSFDFGDRINCLGQLFPHFPVVQAILCEQIMKKSVFWD
jgi:hypothetical protein